MNRRILEQSIALLFCVTAHVSLAQLSFTGTSQVFSGKSISVYEYTDFFTRNRVEQKSTTVQEDGSFKLKYERTVPGYVDIFLNGVYSGLYISPGFEYRLTFDNAGKIKSIDSNDSTNQTVKEFEERSEAFYAVNKGKKNYYQKLEAFIKAEQDRLTKVNPFISEILKYRLGELRYIVLSNRNDLSGLNAMENEFLIGTPIQNNIPDYFRFFKAYTYERAKSLQNRRSPYDFSNHVRSLTSEMKNIKSDSIQQLGYLSILRKAYRSDWSDSVALVNYLVDSIYHVTKNEKVKLIARNVKMDGNAFEPGSSIKDFTFVTHSGETMKLSSFHGKYVLIDFWFTSCAPCIKNFPNIKALAGQKAGKLEVISLTPFDSREKVGQFLTKRPDYTWIFSAIDKEDEILVYFNVLYFPTYFLIGPDGRLIKRIESTEMEGKLETIINLIK